MISCLILEHSGVWRILGIVALFLVAILPATPLLWGALQSMVAGALLIDTAFVAALQTSAVMALLVVITSFLVGLPTGVLAALYEFPGRRLLLVLVTLPLLVPSFLWAIGWSVLVTYLGYPAAYTLPGFTGCFLVLSLGVVPLVLLMSYAATLSLSGSQVEAARLAGGEKVVIFYVCRHVSTLAFLTAGLGGVVTLADPGPGQIFGLRTAAAEMLTSFSALYDFPLAGRQCGALAMLVFVVATPWAFFLAPRISSALLARHSRIAQRSRHRGMARVTAAALTLVVFTSLLAPLVGLTLPLARGGISLRAWEDVSRTAGDTLLYATGAGSFATLLGLLLALCAGRNPRLRTLCIGMLLTLFSLPPALTALGVVQLAAAAPAWADPLLRSRFTVCVVLGLRFFPVAAVLGMRAWGSTSAAWTFAAAVHGLSLTTYLLRVVLPVLLPPLTIALLLAAFLATADVSTVLLLHPPGADSLPLTIFTVMANAPETRVASLCLVYVTAVAGLLTIGWTITGRRNV